MIMSGLPTYHSRAERWECDTNGHWNTRFFMRSFQAASVMAGSLHEPPALPAPRWHMRFHKELFAGSPLEVRSSRIPGGGTLHLLVSLGELRAAAIEEGGAGHASLPLADPASLTLAQPRGITGILPGPWAEDPARDIRSEVGFARPADLDPAGRMWFDEIMTRCAHASARQICQIGFSPDYIATSGITAMLLEQRANFVGPCPAGVPLNILSRIAHTGRSTFSSAHHLQAQGGETIAVIELCLAAVDLGTRRAVALPDFISAS